MTMRSFGISPSLFATSLHTSVGAMTPTADSFLPLPVRGNEDRSGEGAAKWTDRLSHLGELLADRLWQPNLLELRLLRAARQGKPIVLGSLDRPYVDSGEGRAPLEMLRDFEGLQVRLVCQASVLQRHQYLLARLDVQHAVTVEMVLADLAVESAEAQQALRVTRELSARGLAVRIVLRPVLSEDADDTECQDLESLRELFEAVANAGAFDVRWAPEVVLERGESQERLAQQASQCRYLRLASGFPRPVIGRG